MPSAVPQKDHPDDGCAGQVLEAPSRVIAKMAWIELFMELGVALQEFLFAGDDA
jgi:hypothetical protein